MIKRPLAKYATYPAILVDRRSGVLCEEAVVNRTEAEEGLVGR